MIKRVFSILSGTIMAQIINIGATLLLVKIIVPDVFGKFISWLAYVSIFSILISLRLEIALVLEKDIEKKNQLMSAVVKMIISICSIGTGLLFLVYILNIWQFSVEYLLIFVMCFLNIVYQLYQNYLALLGNIKQLNFLRIFNAFSSSSLQLIFVYYNPTAFNLSMGYSLGFLLSIVCCGQIMYQKIVYYWDKVSILDYITKHSNHIKYSLPANFINALSANIPVILIGYKYGSIAAGTLGLAVRFLGAPVALLSKAILDVYKKDAMQAYIIKQQFIVEYRRTFLILFSLSICIIVSVIFFIDPFVYLFMNDSWLSVAIVVKYLLIMFCVQFIASPLSYAVYITSNQKIDLIWQIALVIVTYSSIWFVEGFYTSLLSYSISLSVLYMIYILISYNLSQGKGDLKGK